MLLVHVIILSHTIIPAVTFLHRQTPAIATAFLRRESIEITLFSSNVTFAALLLLGTHWMRLRPSSALLIPQIRRAISIGPPLA